MQMLACANKPAWPGRPYKSWGAGVVRQPLLRSFVAIACNSATAKLIANSKQGAFTSSIRNLSKIRDSSFMVEGQGSQVVMPRCSRFRGESAQEDGDTFDDHK